MVADSADASTFRLAVGKIEATGSSQRARERFVQVRSRPDQLFMTPTGEASPDPAPLAAARWSR
jgi:hypothetical protein